MSLDQKVLDGVGESFREQGLLLQLGQAWVDRTGGEVIPGVQMSAQEYARLLRGVPLYDEVKGDLEMYVELSGVRSLKSDESCTSEEYKNCLMLRHLPKAIKIVQGFLFDPDYDGTRSYSLVTILKRYDPETGKVEQENSGPGSNASKAISRKKLSEEQFLDFCGLRAEWGKYQSTLGISKEYKETARKVILSFLSDPDYAGTRPYSLSYILECYNPETGKVEREKIGPGNGTSQAISRKKLSEELFLYLCDLRKDWEQYKNTPGISKEYRETARKVIQTFLSNPDYIGTRPYNLSYILECYNPETGKVKQGKTGPGRNALNAIKSKKISEEQFLDLCGLRKEWVEYLRSFDSCKSSQEKKQRVAS